PGCLFCVGVSNGDRRECGEYGGVEGIVGRRTVTGWREKRLGRNSGFKTWGEDGTELNCQSQRRKLSKEAESSKDSRSKSSSSSKGTSRSHHKSSGKSTHVEEPSHTVDDSEERQNQEFDTGNNDEQPDDEAAPRRDCDTTHAEKPPALFDELMDTSFDFSSFVLNRLKIPNLTQEILVGPAFNLLKGTCKSLTELEYHFEECSKAITERLDWHNLEGNSYPFDIHKPLSLILDHQGCQVIPQDYFINNDLEYLKGGSLSRKYSTLVTKIKAASYDIKWIEDMVPNLWSPIALVYDKHAYWGYLDEIEVRREDQKLYTFKEGDFPRLRLQDIEDMLLLLVQQMLTNLTLEERRLECGITDGMLNFVQNALYDIALGIRMKYLPKKNWSRLDKRRALVMVQNINKQLYERRSLSSTSGGSSTEDLIVLASQALSSFVNEGTDCSWFGREGIDGFKLGIGALTGAAMDSETEVSDWVIEGWTCAGVCTWSFVTLVPSLTTLDGVGIVGSIPDPEDEAILELMNLDIISVRLANCARGSGFCGREWGKVMGGRESGGEGAGSRDEGLAVRGWNNAMSGVGDGNRIPVANVYGWDKRVLKNVLKLFALEFKWEEAAVSMFYVGSCKVIVLNVLGNVVRLGLMMGLCISSGYRWACLVLSWVCKGLRVSVTLAKGLMSLVQTWRSPGKGIGVVRVLGL
nr:hypothetical protein [Tanacetum cinerariifolium]